VNLTAEAFAFWGYGGTENWKVHRVWWDSGGAAAWGRSFVKWSGTITIGNEVIEVRDVLGFGEFHRYKSRYYSKLREDALQKLSKVRVVVEYTSVTSGVYYLNRSISDVINILKDLNTDWIYGDINWRKICWVNVLGEENCGFSLYDSLAPEFQTYETIRELAQKRRGEQRE